MPRLENADEKLAAQVPKSAMSRTVFSIVGTLSLVPSADVRQLRASLGPVRLSVIDIHRECYNSLTVNKAGFDVIVEYTEEKHLGQNLGQIGSPWANGSHPSSTTSLD